MASTSSEPKMYSAAYVDNYLDSVENLPNDVQRYLTRIREIDLQCRGKKIAFAKKFHVSHGNIWLITKWIRIVGHLRDVDYYYDQWSNCSTNELESTNAPSKRARAMARIQQNLIAAQELGDEKLQVVTQLQEMIDQKTRQLDADFKNLDYADKDDPALIDPSPKEMHPSSPASYVPSTSNAQRSDEGSLAGSSGTSSNNERNSGNHTNLSANVNTSGSHNSDRNSKRSRRAREVASRGGNNVNSFTAMSKTSQIDLASDSNNSNSNQSNKIVGAIVQQSTATGSSNTNRKQGNNGGGNNNNKKRKRKSARSQNGGNGKEFLQCFYQKYFFNLDSIYYIPSFSF